MQGPNQALRHFLILHFTSLHFTSLHFTLLHFTSLYFTLLHFTSLHFTSLPFTNFTDDIFWLKTSILFFVVQDNFILRFGTRLPTTIFCILIIYLRFFLQISPYLRLYKTSVSSDGSKEKKVLLVEWCPCHGNPKLHFPCTSCIICYHVTQIFEIFHIFWLYCTVGGGIALTFSLGQSLLLAY